MSAALRLLSPVQPQIAAPIVATSPIDPRSLAKEKLERRFSTYQRFFGFVSGWTVESVRLAIDAHDSGSFGLSDLLKVVITRYHGVRGPLEQRIAPPDGFHTEVTGGDRGLARVAREEFGEIVEHRVRPWFPDIFEDHAIHGLRVLHHPWVQEGDVLVPDVRPWPTLAIRYNWLYQRYEAFTAEEGLVPIEGPTWSIVGNGALPHLRGAIRSLADPWSEAKYGQRDEAALSDYLGRKVPIGILPKGIEPSDDQGKEIADAVKLLGKARSGGLFPFGMMLESLENIDAGSAQLFEGLMNRRLAALRESLLGTDGGTDKASPGVYPSPQVANVKRHVVRKDLSAGGRALTRLGLLYTLINYPQLRRDQAPGFRWLMPDPEEQERLDAEAKRATSYGQIVKGWRDAGLEPEDEHLEQLATRLRTIHVPAAKEPERPPPGAPPPKPSADDADADAEPETVPPSTAD